MKFKKFWVWRKEKSGILAGLEKGNLLYDCWRLLVNEHSDWLRPLGNALTRGLKSEEGEGLLSELDKSDFWDRKARARQGREHDGIGIVQGAADEGRLLELAQLLARGRGRFRNADSNHSTTRYPQDVFEVAAALLNWHGVIEKYHAPQSPPHFGDSSV
jgi:hypothetical protein